MGPIYAVHATSTKDVLDSSCKRKLMGSGVFKKKKNRREIASESMSR